MKNLENYGVVSLDTQEMKETEGGFVILLVIAGLLVLSACKATEPLPEYSQ